jgi:hypothetical protein
LNQFAPPLKQNLLAGNHAALPPSFNDKPVARDCETENENDCEEVFQVCLAVKGAGYEMSWKYMACDRRFLCRRNCAN